MILWIFTMPVFFCCGTDPANQRTHITHTPKYTMQNQFPSCISKKILYINIYMNDQEQPQSSGTKQYYVLGFIVLIAIVLAGYLLRGKSTPPASTQTPTAQVLTPTPTPGPITKLDCDTLYYNPVLGFTKYYLSVEGGDISAAKKVDCTFTVSIDNKVIATQSVSSPLTDMPQRGGSTFRCTTPAIEFTPNTPTVVDVVLKDDLKASTTCSASFLFPAP
jgi:hypothetical protein